MASFYLTYRPQRVADLDLEAVREFFERILSSGKVAHAYLFTGPRGTGKTSAARILAKIVNCTRNEAVFLGKQQRFQEPCNTCVACRSITNGSMVDLIEIDAASNRGIDDIRDLREKIRLAPVGARRKVYIIDEVHMLTLEAFNALLKTLEEPPAHALFVLATTEAHKLPETIVSRCVRLTFPRATESEVKRSLDKVVKAEKLTVEGKALALLAGSVDGSFREAVKILEQLALAKKKIDVSTVERELGRTTRLSGIAILGAMVGRDVTQAFRAIDRLVKEGVNWQVVVGQMIEAVRQQILVVLGVQQEMQMVKELKSADLNELLELADLLLAVAKKMRGAEIAQLPLEIMVVRWGEKEKTTLRLRSGSSTARLSGASPFDYAQGGHRTRSAQPLDSARDLRDDKPALKSLASLSSEKEKEFEASQARPHSSNDQETTEIVVPENVKEEVTRIQSLSSPKSGSGVSLTEVEKQWSDVLVAVRPHNHSVEGLLRSTRPAGVNGQVLTIEVFYQFHLDQLRQERFLQIVEAALEQVFATKLRLRYRLGERGQRPIRQAQAFGSEAQARRGVPPVRDAADVENISGEVVDDDVVKVAEEVFGVE